MKSIEVSVIVIHYKDSSLTLQCVESIRDSFSILKTAGEIIIVDNSGDFLHKGEQDIIYIDPNTNTGFSKGNNLGILNSSGDTLILLNNDAFLTPESLEMGLKYLRSHVRTGIWAPALIYKDGRDQKSHAPLPSLFMLADEYLFFNLFKKIKKLIKGGGTLGQPVAVDSIIGACWFIRREIVKNIGLLDEDFFFTSEDVDYSQRVGHSGYQLIVDERVKIIHLGSASQNHLKWHSDKHLHEGRKLYFLKKFNPYAYIIALVIINAGIKIREVINNGNKRSN